MSQAHRKTLRRFEVAQQPRFLTCSCYQRLGLLQNDKIKDLLVERIRLAKERTHFRLLAWVIMPEHFHIVVVPAIPEFPVSKVLSAIKARFADLVIDRWREMSAPILNRIKQSDGSTRFWQHGGGYDRNVRDESELFEKIEYCHDNPRRRGLVSDALDWKWSSAAWYAGTRPTLLQVDPI